jgi:DNA-binding LacI/PurR family transcriptional regulator
MKPISQHDIAEASGVSASTVSRVLTNSPLISEATRQRVREVMDRLNYYPSLAARSLVTQRTYALGVVSPFIADAFAGHIFAGADSVAAENGYHILATFSHGLSEEQDLIKRFVRERRADALIVLNLNLPAEFLANLARDNMPIISVGKPAVERGIPSVSIANGPGSFELMNHMLNHGYRDIAIFTGPTGIA